MKSLVSLVRVAAAVGLASFWLWQPGERREASFRTAALERGDVQVTISATGTVEPEEVVDVGAQVAGRIERLGPDPTDSEKTIDYGSLVDAGTVLAQIDNSIYAAQVEQARATLERNEADLLQLQAKLVQAEREWQRAEQLKPQRAITETDYDLARANYEVARSALAVGQATVSQSKAALHLAEINLGYTTIKSPVKGVIIDRRVNVGQTVVASLNAPSLFLIAKDLKRMQVWASVNEADIGRIYPGQKVRFTVDAYPEETFEGQVSQIRLNATMTQNVVTYTVVVVTDNSHGKLLPYLTANLRFELESAADVLRVPTAALRWRPPPELVKGAADAASAAARKSAGSSAAAESPKGILWLPEGGQVRPLEVEVGLSDGLLTEVRGEGLRAGMSVVVGENRAQQAPEVTNPFGPPRRGAPAGKGGSS